MSRLIFLWTLTFLVLGWQGEVSLASAIKRSSRLQIRQDQPAPNITPFPENSAQLSVWALLNDNPSFSNFTSLANASYPKLVQTLNSTEEATNITVFAPPNEAFQALRDSNLFPLLLSPRFHPLLNQILAGHVHNDSSVFTSDIPPTGQNLTINTISPITNITLQRAVLKPRSGIFIPPDIFPQQSGREKIWANDAQIILADTAAQNGVIQVVDQLIYPMFSNTTAT
jgi:uncharacterized surface protein with fasciclin (FAS1) repeats